MEMLWWVLGVFAATGLFACINILHDRWAMRSAARELQDFWRENTK